MSLKVGIVGLPNVGKSTLFNALLKKRVALSANYPFATIEPNVGVVAVPDERLNKLAELVKAEEKMDQLPPLVPAVVEFVDIAGLVKGAYRGEGLGNQFLAHIREVDAIVHVLRGFDDENVIRAGSVDPGSDREVVETELALADLQTVGSAKVKAQKSKLQVKAQNSALEKLEKALSDGISVRDVVLSDDEKKFADTLFLLTAKPVLYVMNVSEESVKSTQGTTSIKGVNEEQIIVISAKLEEELADLSEEERKEYLQTVGLEQTGLERLTVAAYKLLGLISFLTAGSKEVRAWTIKDDTKAPQAAGVIHSDFEKNFIRAQVIDYEKLIEAGSYAHAKQNGWIRTEGKDYLVKDGDVVEFLVGS